MKILRTQQHTTEEILLQTAQVLKSGGLIIFPTETTYGAGVDATQQSAVDKLLAYKSRREGKPLSIAVVDQAMAEHYVEVNESAAALYRRFLPGPVTVVSKARQNLAQGVASEYGTVGVRIPAYPLILELVSRYGKPITATSANGSGEKRPYTVQDIFDGLSAKQKSLIDLVIDAGILPQNPPSTVIDTTLSTPVIFRQGEINLDSPTPQQIFHSSSAQETRDIARRLLLKHWDNIKTKGLLIALQGSLGAGKTVFAQGIAQFLQITVAVTSPTYVYMLDYPYLRYGVAGQFHHLDLWRIEQPELVDKLELESIIGPKQVIAIEWPSLAAKKLQQLAQTHQLPYLEVTIEDDGQHRTLSVTDLYD